MLSFGQEEEVEPSGKAGEEPASEDHRVPEAEGEEDKEEFDGEGRFFQRPSHLWPSPELGLIWG